MLSLFAQKVSVSLNVILVSTTVSGVVATCAVVAGAATLTAVGLAVGVIPVVGTFGFVVTKALGLTS
ncbi:hypothetical protein NRF20_28745 [Streptomyces sp. R-74717]|uniref:hypothetical protein n=1 Tax=Streptomyces sp. R-74717 TaxID=2969820 RepID=UPI0039B46D80